MNETVLQYLIQASRGDKDATIEQITVGMTVKITYDKYYDIYNPVRAAVLSLEVL